MELGAEVDRLVLKLFRAGVTHAEHRLPQFKALNCKVLNQQFSQDRTVMDKDSSRILKFIFGSPVKFWQNQQKLFQIMYKSKIFNFKI